MVVVIVWWRCDMCVVVVRSLAVCWWWCDASLTLPWNEHLLAGADLTLVRGEKTKDRASVGAEDFEFKQASSFRALHEMSELSSQGQVWLLVLVLVQY